MGENLISLVSRHPVSPDKRHENQNHRVEDNKWLEIFTKLVYDEDVTAVPRVNVLMFNVTERGWPKQLALASRLESRAKRVGPHSRSSGPNVIMRCFSLCELSG